MASAPSILFVLSAAYPYGDGEIFLENELPFLRQAFDKVVLFPMFADGPARAVPGHGEVEVVRPKTGATSKSTEFWRGIRRSGGLFLKEWRQTPGSANPAAMLYRVARTLGIARRVEETLVSYAVRHRLHASGAAVTIYSYWMMQACIGGILAGQRLGAPVVSRAHGGDLYTERYTGNYLPWQAWKLQHLQHILPISRAGADYLMQRYPSLQNVMRQKMRISRLGVLERGHIGHIPGDAARRCFHLVSCSTVYGLKRVPLIYDVLRALAGLLPVRELRWTHIGDGPEFAQLNKRLTKDMGPPEVKEGISRFRKTSPESGPTLEIRLCGNRPNARIIPYYVEEQADLFINYSTSEGIPVSIMEAFSAGIPAAAPDIGGMRELLCDAGETRSLPSGEIYAAEAGLLFAADAPPEDVAEGIARLYRQQAWAAKGRAAYQKWAATYNAEANYAALARFLKQRSA